ncbi:hypothetical protein TELCIR_20248 [Teladorsagia circumcincta]|uniref:PiggyBac transposable element-derived protein domain-containing protein n=1 Tax=Teladorsagia circumcincta TaxID=45464 RepID=A0A2G9TK15_TELCI|nr:hypothetical protein TELCIR_20248 [Teladorsagia circumcincta]
MPDEEDALVPAVAHDEEDLDSGESDDDDDSDEEAESTWLDDAQPNNRWTFNEPTGIHQDVELCQTPLDFYELFLSEELLELIATQTNIYGHQKIGSWKDTDTEELKRYLGLCLQMSRCPLDNQRNYWSLKPRNLARNGHSIAGDIMFHLSFCIISQLTLDNQ